MSTKLFKFEIFSNNQSLPAFKEDGKLLVPAIVGKEYSLKITNLTNEKIVVVIDVDGLNIIDKKKEEMKGQGYILGPHQSHNIEGWHQDNSSVAAFVFSEKEEAYSVVMGDGADSLGTIRFWAFQEKVIPPPQMSRRRGFIGATRGGDPLSKGFSPVGTGYGRQIQTHTTSEEFKRRTETPAQKFEICYVSLEVLFQMGFEIRETWILPGIKEEGCPTPPGWNPEG